MAPLIHNGVYKIRNGEYDNLVADLFRGIPRGPIVGYTARPSNRHDRWRIKNVGSGGNEVTIENVSRPGTYANPQRHGSDSNLVGSHEETIWTVVRVDSGMYYLQSPDAEYVWELPRGADYQNIVLVHHTGQRNTKWMFERLPEPRS